MVCSPPGSSVHGILQAGILEWVAMHFSRGSSQPRNLTQVSRIVGGFFTVWATREAQDSNAKAWVQSLGGEHPLAVEMAVHSSILGGKIP